MRLPQRRRAQAACSSPAGSASASRSRARSSTRRRVLLLDEPLGALDLKLRQEMQVFLKALQRDLGITFVYVTHDQEEALTMSDRMAVFNEGRIEQVGTPAEVYEHPQTEFVAGFVGVSNVLERDGRRITIRPEKIHMRRRRRRGRASRASCARSSTSGWSPATSSSSIPAASSSSSGRTSRRRRSRRSRSEASASGSNGGRSTPTKSPRRASVIRIKRAHVLVAALAVALCVPAAGISSGERPADVDRQGRGAAEPRRVGGLHAAAVGQAVHEGDRLQGATRSTPARRTRWSR